MQAGLGSVSANDFVDGDNALANQAIPNTSGFMVPVRPAHQGPCPACGYCPHCGRGGYDQQPYNPQPWSRYTTVCGTQQPTGTVTITSGNSSCASS